MVSPKLDLDKPVFVIEHCLDCHLHQWNSRHDVNKYISFSNNLSNAIKEHIPNATVLINKVPKEWY